VTDQLQAYHRQQAMNFFWRTVAKQEIDFVEERNGRITAYEFKWSPRAKAKISASFLKSYHATGVIIDRSNFRSFVRADWCGCGLTPYRIRQTIETYDGHG